MLLLPLVLALFFIPLLWLVGSQFFIPKDIKNKFIKADNTSSGSLQPSKASSHRPGHWNISMAITIDQASVVKNMLKYRLKLQMLT